jgi:hypothetical protein
MHKAKKFMILCISYLTFVFSYSFTRAFTEQVKQKEKRKMFKKMYVLQKEQHKIIDFPFSPVKAAEGIKHFCNFVPMLT